MTETKSSAQSTSAALVAEVLATFGLVVQDKQFVLEGTGHNELGRALMDSAFAKYRTDFRRNFINRSQENIVLFDGGLTEDGKLVEELLTLPEKEAKVVLIKFLGLRSIVFQLRRSLDDCFRKAGGGHASACTEFESDNEELSDNHSARAMCFLAEQALDALTRSGRFVRGLN
jgi:hypothetical protein